MASPWVIHVPVTFDTKGILGGFLVVRFTASPKAFRIGSIMLQCDATAMCKGRESIFLSESRCLKSSTDFSEPETVHAEGPLTAAREISPLSINDRTVFSGS